MRPPSPVAAGILELAYLGCYVVVPPAFVTVWTSPSNRSSGSGWLCCCPGSLLHHAAVAGQSSPTAIRRHRSPRRPASPHSISPLSSVSHRLNTFPSGHVAVATAVALTVLPVSIGAGVLFGIVAVGIALGAAAGRYHYGIDVLAGALVGVAAAIVA